MLNIQKHSWTLKLGKDLFWVLIIFCFLSLVIYQMKMELGPNMLVTPAAEPSRSGYLVDTPGCRIQDLEEFSESIKDFIYDEELNCKAGARYVEKLVQSDGKALLADLDLLNRRNITCCYKRLENQQWGKIKSVGSCVPIEAIVEITHDFVEVRCIQNEKVVYKNFYSFIQRRCRHPVGASDKPNVLLIGIDSMSRLNLHRQMPKTVEWLKSHGGIEMFGYNKVGENTFPNLIPLLTGKTETELKSCWPSPNSFFDSCHFIWEEFHRNGFVTAYGEDAVNLGLFNFEKKGFIQQPTDVYLNPFINLAEYETGHMKKLHSRENPYLCIGTKKTAEFLLESTRSFIFSKSEPFFGFFWETSLTHEYLNLPHLLDDNYLQFFKDIEELLNRTVLVFFSDHGIRFGPIRDTYQGYVEERHPFLYFVLPKKFQQQFNTSVMNLVVNRNRLTTPFDVFETLKDLSDLSLDVARPNSSSRGISLFQPIPETRNCSSAGIIPNWCTCHSSWPVPISNEVLGAASAIVDHINTLLNGNRLCAVLSLQKVTSARMEMIDFAQSMVGNITDFIVTIVTSPNFAVFQGIVRHDAVSSEYFVLPPVSRLNAYGTQSKCVSDVHLKLYCFCIEDQQLKNTKFK